MLSLGAHTAMPGTVLRLLRSLLRFVLRMCFTSMCVSAPCVCSASGGLERALDPLDGVTAGYERLCVLEIKLQFSKNSQCSQVVNHFSRSGMYFYTFVCLLKQSLHSEVNIYFCM